MPSIVQSFWLKVLAVIRKELSSQQFETWFAKTNCREYSDSKVIVEVETEFYLEWLKRRHLTLIRQAASEVLGGSKPIIEFLVDESMRPAELNALVAEAEATIAPKAPTNRSESRYDAPPSGQKRRLALNGKYTLDNFVVGASNRLCHAASMAVADDAGHVYNPLFIHGGLGLGKTHLLQGICHNLLEKRPNLRMLYLPCEEFVNQFILALEQNQVEAFRRRYRMLDVLVIDDIHFLANKEHSQDEFFHTFNALYNDQKQIILSSDRLPKEIPMLEERLISRFKWGLVCKIEKPTYETRLAIVRKKSASLGIEIDAEVIDLLAKKVTTSVRELEGAMTRLMGFSRIMQEPIDLKTAKVVLADLLGSVSRRVTVDDIITLVTNHFDIRLVDLQSKCRKKAFTRPRQLCMYLARQHTNHSLNEIGGYFGGRDHSTVLYAIEQTGLRVAKDSEFAHLVDDLNHRLEP